MPKFDRGLLAEEIKRVEKDLMRKDRQPFRRELARVLGIRPTERALKAWANKYPDKWAQAVTMLANLSGYQQGVDINLNVVDPSQMTDVALFAFVKAMSAQLAARAQGAVGQVVDVAVIESTPAPQLATPAEGATESRMAEGGGPRIPEGGGDGS